MEETVGPVTTCRRELLPSVMAANRPYSEFYDFYSISPEYYGYNLVSVHNLLYHFSHPVSLPNHRFVY
jgi:hypothetical protein